MPIAARMRKDEYKLLGALLFVCVLPCSINRVQCDLSVAAKEVRDQKSKQSHPHEG